MKKLVLKNPEQLNGDVVLQVRSAVCDFCSGGPKECVSGSLEQTKTSSKLMRVVKEGVYPKTLYVVERIDVKYPFWGDGIVADRYDIDNLYRSGDVSIENVELEAKFRADICRDCIKQLAQITK